MFDHFCKDDPGSDAHVRKLNETSELNLAVNPAMLGDPVYRSLRVLPLDLNAATGTACYTVRPPLL